ncbi:hypothetical protein MXMO3_03566 (plasmid) [Maritalea myrionectae]|uniref:TRAP transporter small permease protein n=1 Tax=Maritalea myrionectae TaxID=454601 RepID=A0A2R4MJB0_9HYPH|nr:TRAP transporter small permease subunit [Maritalea myrionectae]AVX06069.1 hypothetical protein MXMO3_03566 [Maritalea myrionectae]
MIKIARHIDRLLRLVAQAGAVAMMALIVITMYDVLTRYFQVPKFPGLNSTKLQEAEFWSHTITFATFIGFAFIKNAHVRIDLVRDLFPWRAKLVLELIGLIVFLIPFSVFGFLYSWPYVQRSFMSNEVSSSTVGLSNVWILKSMLLVLFGALFLAGISQLLKCVAGLVEAEPSDQTRDLLSGGHE